MDRAVACVLLVAASPAIAVRAAAAYFRTGRVVEPVDAVGPGGEPLKLRRFAGERGQSDLLRLAAVAAGRMRILGPAPLTSAELQDLPEDQGWRRTAVPGIYSVNRLQQDVGIAYDGAPGAPEPDPPLFSRDGLALVVRSMVAATVTGGRGAVTPDHLRILDVTIANTTMAEALDWIFRAAAERPAAGAGRLVCFVNPGCLNISVRDIGYRAVLHDADLVLPDGIGIKVATRIQGVGLRENVNGTDMFPRLCERAAREGTPIYLLGAREGVARAAADAVSATYPGLRIVGTHHGYVAGEEERVVDEINASQARILLVAMGVPQQELWLARMRSRLAPTVLMGVGGLFDFYSGRIPRAPLWVREVGMEWAWRLAQEPGRMWRRYVIGNPLFLMRVWREDRAAHPGMASTRLQEAVSSQASAAARAVAAARALAARRGPAGSAADRRPHDLGDERVSLER